MDEISIIAENLAEAEEALAEGSALQKAHLKELSALVLGGNGRSPQPDESLPEVYRMLLAKRSDKRKASAVEFFKGYAEFDLHSRLELAREWAALADPFELADCAASSERGYVIAHFGNLYADRAFAAFSEELGASTVLPVEDYDSACEEVSDGSADFCILPIESARDGVMDRFEQMIDQYSLFMVMVCPIRLSDDEWIRYALLAASPCRLTGGETNVEPADRINLRITPDGEALWEVLLAADLLGAKPLECRMSGREEDRTAVYRLTFTASEQARSELIAYLELGYSSYTAIGVYSELSERHLEA